MHRIIMELAASGCDGHYLREKRLHNFMEGNSHNTRYSCAVLQVPDTGKQWQTRSTGRLTAASIGSRMLTLMGP